LKPYQALNISEPPTLDFKKSTTNFLELFNNSTTILPPATIRHQSPWPNPETRALTL